MEEVREQQIDPRDYLRVVLKRRWTVITVFTVIVVSVLIHTYTAVPIYRATSRLVIEKENPNVISVEEVMALEATGTDYYQTQYKIIESRGVAREVIKRLNLQESPEFLPPPADDPISKMRRAVRGLFTGLKQAVAALIRTGEKKTPQKAQVSDSALVSRFIGRIQVDPIRNSRLVDVGFHARDPRVATQVVNTLASAYIDQNLEIKLRAVQEAVKWLTVRIEEERKKVEKAEEALLRYKERHGIVTDFSSDVEQVTAQKLAQLNQQVVEAESRRVEAETRYRQALALRGSPDMLDAIPEVINNELIAQIKAMEVELYKRMSELSKKYGKKHPQMVAIESEIQTLQKRKAQEVEQVVNSLRNEYQVAQARERSLKAAMEKQKKEALDLNQKAIQYGVLQREAESARNMYEVLIKRFKEATLTEDMRTGNIRVVDRAEVPRVPVKPRKQRNILMALIIGLIAGMGLAFFFEYLDNTIKLPEDVKRHLQIPYLGPVPVFDTSAGQKLASNVDPELVALHTPKSTASEAYRGLRTSILFSSAEGEPQVILVSSAGPREGKTITTANLAITMAQAGSSVLILDCDMRRPKTHKYFRIPRDRGMSNLLVGTGDADRDVIRTRVPNLDVIPCGPIPPNPSEMLGSGRMSALLNVLKKRYTRIIIDSPPSTAVTDAVVLSKMVDGVVLVIRAADTPRQVIRNGISQFQSVGANMLGAVLNAVDMNRDSYYYYQYYYYYYGEDGDRKKRARRKKRSKKTYG